jgi:uncharacterized membrane protein YvbJ
MHCLQCGAENPDHANFCNNCGSKIEPYATSYRGRKQGQKKSMITIAVAGAIAVIGLVAAMVYLMSVKVKPEMKAREERSGPSDIRKTME